MTQKNIPGGDMPDITQPDADIDPVETNEWLDSIKAVIQTKDGAARAHYLLERMADEARRAGAEIPFSPTTAYINTIPPQNEI